jgi:hypothetical protein
VSRFKGSKTKVTHQIQVDYVPHMQGIRCMAHRTNLVMQTLFKLNIVFNLENLFQTLYPYFSESTKRHLELKKLVEIMET